MMVAPPGLEPGRPCGQQILSLQRLPFRHGAGRHLGKIRAKAREFNAQFGMKLLFS